MFRPDTRGIFLSLCLTRVALSLLHPECEFYFQLEKEERLCLQYIAEQENRSAEGSVSRNCTSRGWSKPFPPYHIACTVDDDIPETEQSYFATVKLIYTIGYSISLGVLAVAVFILLMFRRLRCARNFIHIQLFLSFILKSVSVFIKDANLFPSYDTNHCTLSTFACKASVVFCHYCMITNFFWLLVEALYLNSLLLSSFYHSRRCLWGLSILGWGVPVVFILLWIGSRVYFEDTECWDNTKDSPYWWIIQGPIVVSIAVNFMLFVNIIRILIQKLNPRLIQFNNSSQYRRLAKSTLLLIPLFGTHYMFSSFLPDYLNNLRFYIELCLGSFQGLLVAVLYCFLNQEVQKEVHMQWLRWQERSYGVVSPAAKGSQMDTPF